MWTYRVIDVDSWSIFLCRRQNVCRHLFFNAGDTNYALLRPANQSTTHKDYVAGKAVDGISDDESSMSHTLDGDYHPWWKVELAYPIWVTHVEITNKLSHGKKYLEIKLDINRERYIDCDDELFMCYFDVCPCCESKGGMHSKITHEKYITVKRFSSYLFTISYLLCHNRALLDPTNT